MRKIGNQLVPLFVAFVVVLPFRVVNDDDLAPEQIAEADAAEAETLAIMEEWLQMPGNDREFNRLLVEELRTGVPMDWDEALRALEADGRRFPAMTRLTGAQLRLASHLRRTARCTGTSCATRPTTAASDTIWMPWSRSRS